MWLDSNPRIWSALPSRRTGPFDPVDPPPGLEGGREHGDQPTIRDTAKGPMWARGGDRVSGASSRTAGPSPPLLPSVSRSSPSGSTRESSPGASLRRRQAGDPATARGTLDCGQEAQGRPRSGVHRQAPATRKAAAARGGGGQPKPGLETGLISPARLRGRARAAGAFLRADERSEYRRRALQRLLEYDMGASSRRPRRTI